MTFLDVPFREKDQAKSLGARWDAVARKWYVPADLNDQLDSFAKWLPNTEIEIASPVGGLSGVGGNQVTASESVTQNGSLNFDHALEDSANTSSLADDKKVKGIQLSSLLRKVQQALRQGIPGATWVVAEIANLNSRRGHIYLELTETNAQGQPIANCRAMIWQSQANALLKRFETGTGSALAIGQKVLLLTEVSFHEQYGFSMVIQDIDSSYTLGELEQNLNNLRKQLAKEGLYTLNKGFELPADFFRIAVIAPPKAAGLGDFRADADLLHKAGLCEFKYFYSAFQGESVEKEMAVAFEAMHAIHHAKPFDALVIIRGGGAKLDLNMLNLYSVSKLLCEAKLPVLTGIGHERDTTILDEISHSRFDTPSKVVAYIRNAIVQQAQTAQTNWKKIEHQSRLSVKYLEQALTQFNQSITLNSQNGLNRWKQAIEPLQYEIQRLSDGRIQAESRKMDTLKQGIEAQVKQRVSLKKQMLEQLESQVKTNAKRALSTQQEQMTQWIALILSSGPKTQLNRGFNIAKDSETHKPVTSAKQALTVGSVELQFADGAVSAQIEQNKGLISE